MMSSCWIKGYDTEFSPRRAHLIKFATCGTHSDCAWAKLDPPIELVRDEMTLETVFLIRRLVGETLTAELPTTIHVHVTAVDGVPTVGPAETELLSEVRPDQITRWLWALLIPDSEYEGDELTELRH